MRSRYWKNKAFFGMTEVYDQNSIARMKYGRAPLIDNEVVELHHMLGREDENYYIFFEVKSGDHKLIHSLTDYRRKK